MAFKQSDLAAGEYVIFHTRSHWKVLVVPVLVFLVAVAGWAVCYFKLIPEKDSMNWLRWTVSAIALLAVVIWVIAPWVRWACRTDTLTNYRLISREGVFQRVGRDIPMDRVHAVTFSETFIERILGAGTLDVQTAAQESDVRLEDVAHVKRRQLQVNEQLLNRDFEAVQPDAQSDREREAQTRRFDGTDNTAAAG